MEKIVCKNLGDLNLKDKFFDNIKKDYPDFVFWFNKTKDRKAYVCEKNNELLGLLIIKEIEMEEIELQMTTLPIKQRLKICTLKVAKQFRGHHLGEKFLQYSLWRWQNSNADEIYITVYEKYTALIGLLEKYGFVIIGKNNKNERVFIKSK